MDITKNFIWTIIVFDEDFKYGDGVNFLDYVETNSEPLYIIL
jgi:hypothetical protein